ncbi:hypothetical protein AVEN_185455-1 [Araneus ventricosus]|uniref:Uncharacterized protein n=1 Tax=Araneus ventricosus TaxID=182803 RepID=A0A4Y2U628_ARAVE|nr:hypothetical protein AVEN_185455-1 [Araneus ventricosus]
MGSEALSEKREIEVTGCVICMEPPMIDPPKWMGRKLERRAPNGIVTRNVMSLSCLTSLMFGEESFTGALNWESCVAGGVVVLPSGECSRRWN